MREPWRLLVALAVPQLVGVSAAVATARGVREWYPSLVKPGFTPPAWLFGPVWTALYLAMGVTLWILWRRLGEDARASAALIAFAIQLVLNGLWSVLFFGLRSPGAALADIVALWLAIGGTIVLAWRVSSTAGLLLVPYWGWVTFAGVLNASIWMLNR